MKKFKVYEQRTITGVKVYEYEVEANNEAEARDLVFDNELEPIKIKDYTEDDVYDSVIEVIPE